MPVAVGGSFSAAPPGLSYSQAKSQVARYVKMPDDAEGLAIAGEKLENAVRRLNERVWNWALTYQEITLVAGTSAYGLNADIKKPRHMHLLDSSDNRWCPIGFKDPKTFELENAVAISPGTPDFYTIHAYEEDGLLTFDKAADASTLARYPTARLRYYRRVIFPGTESAHFGIPAHVDSFLVWWAKMEMAADFMPAKSDPAATLAFRLWDDLVKDDKTFEDWD